MLIGFVLLVSACGNDACDALPVSEHIYPTIEACQQIAHRIYKVRPKVYLLCGEVHRERHSTSENDQPVTSIP